MPSAEVAAQSDGLKQAYQEYLQLNQQGRYRAAIPIAQKALQLSTEELGPEHRFTATIQSHLGLIYNAQGHYAAAEPLLKRALAVRRKIHGDNSPAVAESLNNLAHFYNGQGRYEQAEPLYQQSLTLNEAGLGPNHPTVATILNNIAEMYRAQARYGEAEPIYRRSRTIWEKTLGPGHPNVAVSLNNLALLYEQQGKYTAAEPLYKRSLAIREKTFGPHHPNVANTLNNLAKMYATQGRLAAATPLYERTLAIWERALGPTHPRLADTLNNLAGLRRTDGKYAAAEPLYQRALAINEKAFGSNHPDVALVLNDLALLYADQGRYIEAEPLYKRALAINEKSFGSNHPNIALNLNNLAALYNDQGRHTHSEALYVRSLAIIENAVGPNHPKVALGLNNLGKLRADQRRFADAEALYKRALTINESLLGLDHPEVANNLNNLAGLYGVQDRHADALPFAMRSARILENAFGPNHPELATVFNNLAGLYKAAGRFTKAASLYNRSLAIREKFLRPNHPIVARSFNNIAELLAVQGDFTAALETIRRASKILRTRAERFGAGTEARRSEQQAGQFVFISHVEYAFAVAQRDPPKATNLMAETFELAQLARATSVGAAVANIGARFAVAGDQLAETVRQFQDATERWQRLDDRLIASVSLPPERRSDSVEQVYRTQLAELERRLKRLNQSLNTDFPEYAELASPKPVSLRDTQALLGPGEALLTWLVRDELTYLWVVRRGHGAAARLELPRADLTNTVTELRDGLDTTGIATLSDIPPFNTRQAFVLYEKLLAPAEKLLDGITHLFVVPDGALQSLPLGVLVTEKPTGTPGNFSDYRKVPWLAKKYALTTLPAVSSLRALRRFAATTRASKPFRGFGDPLLEGHPGSSRGVKLANLFTSRGVADVEAVRSQLSPLPETADELISMAKTLGASDDSLFLRDQATEHNIKTQDLKDYRVLAFATHGLVSGDLKGLAEPALVLTPPKNGTPADDGLLTASEVAQLQLNSDLVVLSACNTASSDGTAGAEALSGLAKAFFYAGSRALLVSHWPVNSDASVQLTSRMLEETTKNGVGRAEALRRSMLSLMMDEDKPHYAHPVFWAPFVVVGEGGTYRPN